MLNFGKISLLIVFSSKSSALIVNAGFLPVLNSGCRFDPAQSGGVVKGA
ncbi:hypothetical protein RBY4I_3446 [Rhodobacterales bacterium Y4I]|nr:hypothetical protein RBY4I_3446 [Rhodobacterales bacterium Y4I]